MLALVWSLIALALVAALYSANVFAVLVIAAGIVAGIAKR